MVSGALGLSEQVLSERLRRVPYKPRASPSLSPTSTLAVELEPLLVQTCTPTTTEALQQRTATLLPLVDQQSSTLLPLDAQQPSTQPPLIDRRRVLLQLCVLTGCGMAYQATLGMCMPLYGQFAAHLGLGEATGGLVLAAPCVARVLLNFSVGSLVDSWGRKPLLIGGSMVMAVGAHRTASATSLSAMLVGRLLVGAGGAASEIAAHALRLDIAQHFPEKRGMLLGWVHALHILAYAAGPAAGGHLSRRHGVREPFYLFGYTLLATALIYLLLPASASSGGAPAETSPRDAGGPLLGRGAAARRELLRDQQQVSLLLFRFSLTAGWASWMIVLPSHLTHAFGLDTLGIGVCLSVMTLVGFASSPIGGCLADRFGAYRVSRLGAVASAVALGVVPCASSLGGVWALLALWEVGTATMSAATSAAAAAATRPDLRGAQSSLLGQVQDGTFALLPAALGMLAARVGTAATLGLAAALQLSTIAAVGLIQRRRRSPATVGYARRL